MPVKIQWRGAGSTWLGSELSNKAFGVFTVDGRGIVSAEGFWQSLKFPVGSVDRTFACGCFGNEAKGLSKKGLKRTEFYYDDKCYQVGSAEHLDLMKRVVTEKIRQKPELQEAFLATGDQEFTLEPEGQTRKTVLTAEVFCEMLSEIREELRNGDGSR